MSKFILTAFVLFGLCAFADGPTFNQTVIANCDGGLGDVWINYDIASQSVGSGDTVWVHQFTVSGKSGTYSQTNAQLTHGKNDYNFVLTVDGVAHICKASSISG